MTRLLKTLALAAAIVMLAVPGFAQMGGIKEPNLSPELDLLVNQGISVYNSTGSTITAGTLVYVCGYTETATGYVRSPTSARPRTRRPERIRSTSCPGIR